jgi:hypothetical protein
LEWLDPVSLPNSSQMILAVAQRNQVSETFVPRGTFQK